MKAKTNPLAAVDRRPGQERKEEAVAAVLKLAAEDSPERITTARIAQEMQVSAGAMFRHFADKEALWEAVMGWVGGRLNARLAEAEQADGGAAAVLERMFAAHVAFVAAHPGVPRLIFAELQRPEDTPAKRAVRGMLAAYGKRLGYWLRQGREDGELRADLDEDAAALMFIGCVQGLVMQSLIAGGTNHLVSAAPGVFGMYLHAIRSKP